MAVAGPMEEEHCDSCLAGSVCHLDDMADAAMDLGCDGQLGTENKNRSDGVAAAAAAAAVAELASQLAGAHDHWDGSER